LDVKLAEKIRAMEAEKERLTLKVTGLRREAPAKAAENFKTRWTIEEESFNAKLDEAKSREEGEKMELDVGEFKRWDDVQTVYEQSTDGLVKLKTDLTETVAKLERAKGVATYMQKQQS
jgi:kinetochor protein Mis14/NSL1